MDGIKIFGDVTRVVFSPEMCTEADFGGQIVPGAQNRSHFCRSLVLELYRIRLHLELMAERREAERREAERREAERREAERREAERREAERREAERRAMLEQLRQRWKSSGYEAAPSAASFRRWARLTVKLDGLREGRTRHGKSCRHLRKARLSKRRNLSGNAGHMQIYSDYGAILQTVRRSFAEAEESTQILKIHCNSYNELSSTELICEPRSPGNSKGCNTGQNKEDDLMTRFAPVLKQSLHDALEPILGPVARELQSQEEEARKERQRLLVLEKQKLALNLQELERLKRRRAGGSQRRHLTI